MENSYLSTAPNHQQSLNNNPLTTYQSELKNTQLLTNPHKPQPPSSSTPKQKPQVTSPTALLINNPIQPLTRPISTPPTSPPMHSNPYHQIPALNKSFPLLHFISRLSAYSKSIKRLTSHPYPKRQASFATRLAGTLDWKTGCAGVWDNVMMQNMTIRF